MPVCLLLQGKKDRNVPKGLAEHMRPRGACPLYLRPLRTANRRNQEVFSLFEAREERPTAL